ASRGHQHVMVHPIVLPILWVVAIVALRSDSKGETKGALPTIHILQGNNPSRSIGEVLHQIMKLHWVRGFLGILYAGLFQLFHRAVPSAREPLDGWDRVISPVPFTLPGALPAPRGC